jgi:hypothetical protein
VGSGERADAPRSRPWIQRVQARLGRPGLWIVGAGTMAARERRAWSASTGDDSLCPLPQVPRAEGEWAEACEALGSSAHARLPVWRAPEEGAPARMAQGDERPMPLDLEVEGTRQRGTERRLGGRAGRQAQAAEVALRARVATAQAPVEALHQRGRQRFAEGAA